MPEQDGCSLKTGHWLYLKDFRQFSGSVKCFENLFGFSSQRDKYSGTIFRFPLRNHASDISNNQFNSEIVIRNLYKSLVEEAPFILLFLKSITRIGLYCYNEKQGCEKLLYEILVDHTNANTVQRGRKMCQERAMKWTMRTDIFCHLNSLTVSFKNNFMKSIPREGTYHWLVMNCIAGKSCRELEPLSRNLNVIPWAGVAAQLPIYVQLLGDNTISLDSDCLDISNHGVSSMLDSLSKYSQQIPWQLEKPPDLPGHAFCFLPLPSHIGLPVFVHGYFSVADNRRSIKWPSHDEQGEEARFNQALVENLIIPTYAFLLACRSSLITYEEMPLNLYENPQSMLDPYCIWPLLSQQGQAYSMWSTVVDPVIKLLVNHNLPIAWTAAGGGRRTSLLSALYLPGTFTGVTSNVSNVVIEMLTALDKSVVILPAPVAQVIARIQDTNIRQKIYSREISPPVIRNILKETAAYNGILWDKHKCAAMLDYVLSDLSENSCHELQNLSLLPVEKSGELPRPFLKEGMDCLYILADQQCSSFLTEIADHFIWSGLSYAILQQLKKVVGFKQYQLKIADADTVCTELLPKSMSKWTNHNGDQVLWRPGVARNPPLQWLIDVWSWLNKTAINEVSINSLSIIPKECLKSSLPTINLIPLSYSKKCFLISDASSVSMFLPKFLESLGFMIVYETPFVFAQSQIKEKFNPISPDSVIKVLSNNTVATARIVEGVETQPHSDKTEFLHFIAQVSRNALSGKEKEVIRKLPLFKPVGSNRFISLNDQEWIILTSGITLLPNLQYPPKIISYSSLEECRFLKLLGCCQPTFTKLCTDHVIPFALSSHINNAGNTHRLMKWILGNQLDVALKNCLSSCKFVPRGISGELVKPCDLFDPEDPYLRNLFDQHEDCLPSNLYHDCLHALRSLGLQTWDIVSRDGTKFNQFLIDRAKSVSILCTKNYVKAFERSCMIVLSAKCLPDELVDIPFLFCQNTKPYDYPKQLKWYGEGIKDPFTPRKLYPANHKLLIGSVGPVVHEDYPHAVLSGTLNTPNMLMLIAQLTVLTSTLKPSRDVSNIVYLIYHQFNEKKEHLIEYQEKLPSKWIWIETYCRFVSADKCAVDSLNDLDLSPHCFSLSQIHQLKDFLGMFLLLRIPQSFNSGIVGEVLSNIKLHCQVYGLDQNQLKTILQILQWMHKTGKQNVEVLIPTENMQLLPPKDCTYNDLNWTDDRRKQRGGYTYVHQELPSARAKYFQVVPLSHRIVPSKTIGLKYSKMGPHQSVTGRLKEAIEEYGGDVDVFKELIQNADDARATQVKFIIDWRQHSCATLLEPEMKHWQGPALLAYNNGIFTQNDFDNICELAGASKKSDPTKIGRFGIGFCSIYHLTDVPSFISDNHFVVFDPHTSYLGSRVTAGEPGMKIDMKELCNNLDVFKDQFAPYWGLLGFNMTKAQKGYDSTFFRFPFRNDHTARKSKISETIYDRKRVEKLCDTLKKSAPDLLVFLQNVREISLYELNAQSNVDDLKCLLSVTKTLEPISSIGQTLIEQFRQGYSLDTCQKKLFKIQCCVGQTKEESHWIVTSCLGTDKSKTISQSPTGKFNGLCPLGEIGVKLDRNNALVYPQPANGKLFCFLPLPIDCRLKFYCSGYFEVSKDRRWLKKDASSGRLNEWNSAIIRDALYKCFIETLVNITKINVLSAASEPHKEKFLTAYYGLWPNVNSTSFVGRFLFNEIQCSLCHTNSCILWSDVDGGMWLSPKRAYVYNHHDKVTLNVRKDIIQLLLKQRYPVVDIPYDIKSIMSSSINVINYNDFCRKVLIPNVATLPVKMRDDQIIALLSYVNHGPETQWAVKLLTSTSCIPTRPNGRLRKPSDLIDPNSNLAKLYTDADECFPVEAYVNEVADALKSLGMSFYKLSLDKLKERASSVKNLSITDAMQRAKQILVYLSYSDNSFGYLGMTTDGVCNALQDIPFIPVLKLPQGISLPWFNSSTLFQSPKKVYSYNHKNLMFTQAPVVMSFDSNDHSSIGGLSKLGVENKYPSIEMVTAHLACLVRHCQQKGSNSSDCELLNNCCPAVYSFLQNNMMDSFMQNSFKNISKLLRGLPFIWQDNHFLTVEQIKLDKEIADAFPYLCELSDENKKYKKLFIRLGVVESFSQNKLLSVLECVYNDHKSKNLSDEYIKFVITIVTKLGQAPLPDYGRILYLPDENGIMQPASKLAYKESIDLPALHGSEVLTKHFSEGTFWLHHMFTATLAKSLGIPSALNSILNEMSNKNFLRGTEYGQCENLCDRLNSILRKYPHDESIFKEFIQNADDAGASEIVFILDHRKFDAQDGELFSSDPEWKSLRHCPSLLVYNNKLMSEEDIIGITKLGRGNKEFSPDLIGRFGIGFNVAYHVADCAMFVSYGQGVVPENFCILDPGGLFAPGHRQATLRGRRFEMNPVSRQQFAKEFDPFYDSEVFLEMSKMCDGCFSDIKTQFCNGCVLFRLPFTRSISHHTALASGYKMDTKHMQKLFRALSYSAEDLVLFLNNIKSISAFEIKENGTCLHHFTTSVFQSSKDAAIRTEHVKKFKLEVKNLRSKLDDNRSDTSSELQIYRLASRVQGRSNDLSHDGENVEYNSFPEITWSYQLKVDTVTYKPDTKLQKFTVHKTDSVWVISQQFGSRQMPICMLKAALSDGLVPRGGVAVRVYGNETRTTPFSLFCSLPLPIASRMPVHINGNFWVDDSRKHLEFGANVSTLTGWNCCLTKTVIANAYINALVCCKQFLPDKSTEWYYSIFPEKSNSHNLDLYNKEYPFGLYKSIYVRIVRKNLSVLQEDTLSLTSSATWLPVMGKDHGYFFPAEEQILRKLLIEFGVKLTKAPLNIYDNITMAASIVKVNYSAIVDPVVYIQLLKSLNLQQHKENIIKNIIVLLKYCLSTEEGCNAIRNAPLLMTCSGNLRQMSTVYGSVYTQLLPNRSDDFIHPELEKHDFIYKLATRGFYTSVPSLSYVSTNLQIKCVDTAVDVGKCLEIHSQMKELWKYLNTFLNTVRFKQYSASLSYFTSIPIIPASNKTLVPVCKAKMVLSPNGGGNVRKIMKMFGYPVLDFSVLCESTFPTLASALDRILTHCNNGDDILNCIKLNDSSPILPSSCNLGQYKEDLQLFLNMISTSYLLNATQNFLCKLPIFEAVTDAMVSIKHLQNTYLIPDGVPSAGLKEVMKNSSVVILKHLPFYVKVYKSLKIQQCDVAQFYLRAIIPFLQAMDTKDIICHVTFLFHGGVGKQYEVLGALKASKFIYVASSKKWCSVSEFYDPHVKLFQDFPEKFSLPPKEWCSFVFIGNLRLLGLQKDASWQCVFDMVKDVEKKIKNNDKNFDEEKHQENYHTSKVLLEFICSKLPVIQDSEDTGTNVSSDPSVDEALQFCRDISKIVFVPTHKDSSIIKEIFKDRDTKLWTKCNNACFETHYHTTFLERDIITSSFSLSSSQQLYIAALGIEDPPSCSTVTRNLLQLSQIAQSRLQSSEKQCVSIKNFLKKLFDCNYVHLEKYATLGELRPLQGRECLFVENLLTYFVVSGDCLVKSLSEPLIPFLCQIPQDVCEHQKIITALRICDVPTSFHYARILERIHLEFITSDKKLSENSKYLELASKACDCLVDVLNVEEANQSVPENFDNTHLYLLDKQNELHKATDLAYDDVPWFSKRLQAVASYKYMKPFCQGRQAVVPLPLSLGVKLLSSLVFEELDENVHLFDNHCADERRALQRGQSHGCQFILSLENLLISSEFKLGLQRIIYHQKQGVELTEKEVALTNKLHNLKFSCYYKIVTVLKKRNGQIVQGSSLQVFSVLCESSNQNPLLCLAPHCDDKDGVVKELAQNINRYLSCIVKNESHLEAMIKSPSHLDIETALDKCKVKSYTAADHSIQKLPSVGECMTPIITDLLIVLNYNKGESIKYWEEGGKLILAKVVAIKSKLLTDLSAKSLTISTSEDNNSTKINTSPIFVSKYLQPSFLERWLSNKKMMDCSGLLLYHLENKCNPLLIQKSIMLSFKSLSCHQIGIVFKRLFFHLHFYFVKCCKNPSIFYQLSTKYFEKQVALFEPSLEPIMFNSWLVSNFKQIILLEQSLISGEEDELSELFEDMCIYASGGPDPENDSDTRNEDMADKNPFENREFIEQDSDIEEGLDNLHYRQKKQNIHYRKAHLQKAVNISGAAGSQHKRINTTSQPASTQLTLSSGRTAFTNAFSQPVIHSTPTTGNLFRTSTGGYRSRVHRPRLTPVTVWNQTTNRSAAAGTASTNTALPKTNFKVAFMWLQQAIADFNAAKYYIQCTRTVAEQSSVSKTSSNGEAMEIDSPSPCQFPALICFLSHEVVEKSLKAAYLAKCDSTLANQHDSNLVALYDQLKTARCWPLPVLKDLVLQVSDHNMRCRYPDLHVPPEAPCVLYTELDARHALAAAQEVFIKVCSIDCFKNKLPSQPATLRLLPSIVYLDPNSKL